MAILAKAYLFTAGVSLVSVTVNTAIARADSTSRAALQAKRVFGGAVTVSNDGTATAEVLIKQVNFGAVTVGVIVGQAIAAGEFEARMTVSEGRSRIGSLTIRNDVISDAVSKVTPAAGGVDLHLIGASVNLAMASNTTRILTTLNRGGEIFATGAVEILTTASSYSTARVIPPW